MDTTYFGKKFGVMLFKDAYSGNNLLKYYVNYETNKLYKQGITELQSIGFKVEAIVCDGRRGLSKLFPDIPLQMCIFHQVAIITRYLTRKPRHASGLELRRLCLSLKDTDKESFVGGLRQWHEKWEGFLAERTINPITHKSHYTHQRLRSAYRSLNSNLDLLFTWYDYPELNIPTTTNAIDGHFSDLKNKLRNHNGLTVWRKKKFIDGFLKA